MIAPAHLFLGLVEILSKRAVQSIGECNHALELDRNLWVEWSASQLLLPLPAAN
jgi:hypothetical protein